MTFKYRLILANDDEIADYNSAEWQEGLPAELDYLRTDPLAQLQRKGKSGVYDHVHLSVPEHNKTLVQWWGRVSSGYHRPIGDVMKMVKDSV